MAIRGRRFHSAEVGTFRMRMKTTLCTKVFRIVLPKELSGYCLVILSVMAALVWKVVRHWKWYCIQNGPRLCGYIYGTQTCISVWKGMLLLCFFFTSPFLLVNSETAEVFHWDQWFHTWSKLYCIISTELLLSFLPCSNPTDPTIFFKILQLYLFGFCSLWH